MRKFSEQLRKELPGLKGFSESNIKNMRQFYETWTDCVFRQPLASEIENLPILQLSAAETNANKISQPSAGENESPVATEGRWGNSRARI